MIDMDDTSLDQWLAAGELPAPPPHLVRRAAESLREHHRPAAEASQRWLARLAQARDEFRQVLCQPQFAGMALATRGGEQAGAVVGDADAALGHAVQGLNIRGQVFLTALESPADLRVELRDPAGAVVEETRSDEVGRFRFLGLQPDTYTMVVPELELSQEVEVRA